MTIPLPDSRILGDVLRLCDAVDAVRARQPAGPRCYCPADGSSLGEPAEMSDLREHLRGLSEDYQAQIHAVYWLGRKLDGDRDQFSQLYRYALATDLGAAGRRTWPRRPTLGRACVAAWSGSDSHSIRRRHGRVVTFKRRLTWRTERMWRPTCDSKVNEAVIDVRKGVEKLIELGFQRNDSYAIGADGQFETLRIVMTDAILAAFPRAEDQCKRSRLIRLIDAISPPDHEEALALLERLAAEDPHPEVRLHAERIHYNLKDRASLEVDLANRPWPSDRDRDPRSALAGDRREGRHTRPSSNSSRPSCAPDSRSRHWMTVTEFRDVPPDFVLQISLAPVQLGTSDHRGG